jgi:hypothetical protein
MVNLLDFWYKARQLLLAGFSLLADNLFCNLFETFKLLGGWDWSAVGNRVFIGGFGVSAGRSLLWNSFVEFEVEVKLRNCSGLWLLKTALILSIIIVAYQNSLEFWLFCSLFNFVHHLVNGLISHMISGSDLAESVELSVVNEAYNVNVALERDLGTLLLHCLNATVFVQVQILLVHLRLFRLQCNLGIHFGRTFSHDLILCF